MADLDWDRQRWERATRMLGDFVIDNTGRKIGRVRDIAEVGTEMKPEWLVVKTSLFGRRRLIPMAAVHEEGKVIRVPFSNDLVLSAPVPAIPVTLSDSEREALAEHYARAA